MHISGTSHVHGPHGINPPHSVQRNQSTKPAPEAASSVDQLDISPAANAAVDAADATVVRQDLVNQIRAEIAAGTYETPEKLDQALDRLLDEIG